MKEDIAYDFTNAYTIRGWPLMRNFEKFAMEIVQHGLYHCWETQVIIIIYIQIIYLFDI